MCKPRLLFFFLLSACGTARPKAVSSPLMAAGPRCADHRCACRSPSVRDTELPIAKGQKRFEIRTGHGLTAQQITVQDRGTLEKSGGSVDVACGYIDLPPGKHQVHYHAQVQEGVPPAFFIAEYGEEMRDWYDSFRFSCGEPSCTMYDLGEWKRKMDEVDRGIFDKCGSVRIRDLKYEAQHRGEQVTELDIDLVLDVYDFPPRFPHGTEKCKGLPER